MPNPKRTRQARKPATELCRDEQTRLKNGLIQSVKAGHPPLQAADLACILPSELEAWRETDPGFDRALRLASAEYVSILKAKLLTGTRDDRAACKDLLERDWGWVKPARIDLEEQLGPIIDAFAAEADQRHVALLARLIDRHLPGRV
jgi:hypothetical protein